MLPWTTRIAGWLIILVLAACSSNSGPSAEDSLQPKGFFPYDMHVSKLPNELQVVTIPYDSPGLASFYIIVRVGSRHEVEAGKTGFAHFFEHMMFRGTDQYPNDKYNEVMMSIGAAANANTWLDRTVYHMTGNADELAKMFEIEADRFMHLNYSVGDFKVEAGAVKGEYTKNFASQFRQIDEQIKNTAFDAHTYKHTTMGFFEDIVDMPNQYDYSLTFYDRFYRPEYSTILVVGDVSHDEVMTLTEKYFGMWETGDYKPEIPEEPAQTETRYTHISNAGFIPTLMLNYKTPAFDASSKETAALSLINQLAFSERSELYKQLVVDEQKCLNLWASYYFTSDPYLFSVNALSRDEAVLPEVREAIAATITDLQNNPVDSTLLAQTKSNSKYSFLMGLDDPQDMAETLSYFIWVSGDPTSMNTYYDTYMSLTAEDVMETARKYFQPERLTIATISSKEEGGIQ